MPIEIVRPTPIEGVILRSGVLDAYGIAVKMQDSGNYSIRSTTKGEDLMGPNGMMTASRTEIIQFAKALLDMTGEK